MTKFLKNIKYLMKNNLKEKILDLNESELIEQILFEIPGKHIKRPNIHDVKETIEELVNSNKSICRFGDGEISLINGKGIPFQQADKILSKRLKEILNLYNENFMIGINYHYYYSLDNLLPFVKTFYRSWVPQNRQSFTDLLNYGHTYYSAQFNQVYMTYDKYNFEEHYQLIRKIWEEKHIVIICGAEVFPNIKYNIFDNAESIEYIIGPSLNAFSHYNDILYKALELEKEKIVIIILGPAGKVLTADLWKNGYRALDLGHLAKDYDWYKRSIIRNNESISKFFMPD